MRLVTRVLRGLLPLAVMTAVVAGPIGAAHAATNVTGGSTTLTATKDFLRTLAKRGVLAKPTSASSVVNDDGSVATTWTVTGGDADINAFTGRLDHAGGLVLKNWRNYRKVTVTNLRFDVFESRLIGQVGTTTVPLVDVAHFVSFTSGNPMGFNADSIVVNPDGAAFLNRQLRTDAFVGGAPVGSLRSSWTFTPV